MAEWQDIASAPEGVRVRVGHSMDPSSLRDSKFFNTTGVKQDGKWACDSGFVCTDGMFRFDPDRWLPTPPETTA